MRLPLTRAGQVRSLLCPRAIGGLIGHIAHIEVLVSAGIITGRREVFLNDFHGDGLDDGSGSELAH